MCTAGGWGEGLQQAVCGSTNYLWSQNVWVPMLSGRAALGSWSNGKRAGTIMRNAYTHRAKANLRWTPGPIVSSSDYLCSQRMRPTSHWKVVRPWPDRQRRLCSVKEKYIYSSDEIACWIIEIFDCPLRQTSSSSPPSPSSSSLAASLSPLPGSPSFWGRLLLVDEPLRKSCSQLLSNSWQIDRLWLPLMKSATKHISMESWTSLIRLSLLDQHLQYQGQRRDPRHLRLDLKQLHRSYLRFQP